jgi:putative endonuclease
MIDIPKKIWTVYLLECSDKTLYCGITNNLDNRLKQHRGERPGGAKYTRSRAPLKLLYQEKSDSRSEALKRELVIKKMSRNAKLELIRNSINSEVDLSH